MMEPLIHSPISMPPGFVVKNACYRRA
jgi:hypothetical protein